VSLLTNCEGALKVRFFLLVSLGRWGAGYKPPIPTPWLCYRTPYSSMSLRYERAIKL